MKGHWLVSLSSLLHGKLTSISLELAERRESAISSDGEWVIDQPSRIPDRLNADPEWPTRIKSHPESQLDLC